MAIARDVYVSSFSPAVFFGFEVIDDLYHEIAHVGGQLEAFRAVDLFPDETMGVVLVPVPASIRAPFAELLPGILRNRAAGAYQHVVNSARRAV
jgi:hypothetical protein